MNRPESVLTQTQRALINTFLKRKTRPETDPIKLDPSPTRLDVSFFSNSTGPECKTALTCTQPAATYAPVMHARSSMCFQKMHF